MPSIQQNNLENLEYRGGTKQERRELSAEELVEQEVYYAQLNEAMYGVSNEYSGVQSARNRSTYENADQSVTLAVASKEGAAPELVNQQLREMRETSNDYASSLGAVNTVDRARFSDIDVRAADATAYAQASGHSGENGMLHSQERIRAEKATAMESALRGYLEGRNTELFNDIDESLSITLRIHAGQLVERYGDITKASNKELESLYNEFEAVKGTAAAQEPEIALTPESADEVSPEPAAAILQKGSKEQDHEESLLRQTALDKARRKIADIHDAMSSLSGQQ